MPEEKKCNPCGGAKADGVPCEEGAIQVHIRTCLDGDWIEDWVPLGDIVPTPAMANKNDQRK